MPGTSELYPARSGSDPILPAMAEILATLGSAQDSYAESANTTPAEALQAGEIFWERGYVKEAATLPRMLADGEERTDLIAYWQTDGFLPLYGLPPESATEDEALAELDRYLIAADAMLIRMNDPANERLRQQLRNLRQQLVFISRQAFNEGAAGISQLWRTYLEKDPDLELIVPYLLGSVPLSSEYLKSQQLLFPAVMQHFPKDDPLRARIHGGRQAESAKGRHGRLIILDDWVKSTLQVTELYRELRHPKAQPIEVHLLAASRKQLDNGIKVSDPDMANDDLLQVVGYFRAGDSTYDRQSKGPLVTGSHSSVDFDFTSVLCEAHCIGDVTDEHGQRLNIPMLARIAHRRAKQ